ncbi:MFS transporter [Lachnotalea glycerini]|uniref:MFS transporter n=1 Tax=Lachnotalea glycerini TaxID=1763509 RepID=A0A318EPU1_9FIRM|nr:MFS transporter [Lachnotalea glycerini]PXV87745.1 MFS transporter [Lachnotalea glycerini]
MKQSDKSYDKFLVLWLGELISAIGSGLTSFGLGVYVYEQTGRASAMTLVTLLAFLPSLLLSVPAGVLADRYDRRILMVLGDSLSVIGLLYILYCMSYGEAKLWQIYIGVTISSVFSSLLEPAFKATITDLLTKEEYSKASGLVQIANSAKYLISPILAGFLLSISDIKLLLVVDISTFFVTVYATLMVRSCIATRKIKKSTSFVAAFREGWDVLSSKKGIKVLIFTGSLITFCIAFIQTLSAPMILAFSNSAALGTMETVSACGILVSSIIIGFLTIRGGYTKFLSFSLFGAGICMAGFGFCENIIVITCFGFLFFASLPFANMSLDYLIRSNIDNSLQGRAWGLISLISQLGYVVAYATLGLLADYVFTPLLRDGGALAGSIGAIIGIGDGRGSAFLILLAGILLCIISILLYQVKAVHSLDKEDSYVFQNHTQ